MPKLRISVLNTDSHDDGNVLIATERLKRVPNFYMRRRRDGVVCAVDRGFSNHHFWCLPHKNDPASVRIYATTIPASFKYILEQTA